MDHDQFLKNLITSNQSLSKKGFSYMAAYASCINISFNSIQLLLINASTCIYLMSHLKFMMIYKPYSLIYIDKGIFSEGYTCSTTWKLIVTLSFLCYMNRKNKLYFDHLMPIFLEWIDILYQVKCFVWQLPSDLNSDHQLITEILGQPMEQGISFHSDVNH